MKILFISVILVAQLSFAQFKKDVFQQNMSAISLPSETASSAEKKSVGLAAFYSLLLPGMGELYVGDYSSGKYSTIAEAALWIGWTGYQLYGNWVQTDARNFAVQHASVNLANKEDQFFTDIENFPNVYAFNTEMYRERQSYKAYNSQSASYWSWDNDVNRASYRDLRVSSDETFNSSRYVAAAIVVNHVLSAFSAARQAISHNDEIEKSSGFEIHARLLGNLARTDGVMISVSKNF